jgi:HEAT repeat protein
MLKKTLFTLLLSVAVSHAAVKELIPSLTSDDLNVQTQARLDLLAVCSNAGRPDAETERVAVCLEICEVLKKNQPVVTVVQPMINNLERIGGEESVPTLVKYLGHKDEHIRDDARRALSVNPSAAAGQALGAQLKMRRARPPKETAGYIYALGERKESGASRLIAGYLSSKDQEIFIAAVKALGRLNEDAGIKALLVQRPGEQGFRRMQIDAALFETNRSALFEKFYAETESAQVRSVALLGLLLQGDSAKAPEAMASGDPALQVAVIEAALQGRDAKVYDSVAESLESLPSHIQLQALGALEFSGNRSYAKVVEPLLVSPDPLIRQSASTALARIGSADSVAGLITSGTSASRRALGMLNVDGVDEVLEMEAARKGDDVRRAVAIEALAIRGRRDLMQSFFAYAAEDGPETSKSAVKAVGMIGDLSNLEQLARLMVAMEASPISRDILGAIVEIMRRSTEPGKAVEILVARMDGASPRSQSNILKALEQTGSNEALESIVEACRSDDETLQKQAVKLLSGWKSDNAIPDMIELASDKSMSLANHVTIMRGVSRILAGQNKRQFKKEQAVAALEACRREEEKQMIQDILDKHNK